MLSVPMLSKVRHVHCDFGVFMLVTTGRGIMLTIVLLRMLKFCRFRQESAQLHADLGIFNQIERIVPSRQTRVNDRGDT